MATRLSQMNGALDLLGHGPLVSVTEEGNARRALDRVWGESVQFMLASGLWNFATRSSELGVDDDYEPLFGYRNAFAEPEDFVRTISISEHGFTGPELQRYQVENKHWFSDAGQLYLRYVSNDAEYGLDLGRWPEMFSMAHQAYLAFKSGLAIVGDKGSRADVFGLHEKWLSKAKVLDAVEQKVGRQPMGRWAQARNAGRSGRRG